MIRKNFYIRFYYILVLPSLSLCLDFECSLRSRVDSLPIKLPTKSKKNIIPLFRFRDHLHRRQLKNATYSRDRKREKSEKSVFSTDQYFIFSSSYLNLLNIISSPTRMYFFDKPFSLFVIVKDLFSTEEIYFFSPCNITLFTLAGC